jgi:hypothetical protein
MHNPGDSGDGGLLSNRKLDTELIGSSLQWKRTARGWRLFDGRRRFGEVVPDSKHPGMWRCVLSGGRLSDMANLSWARNAVLDAAVRELLFEARQVAATDPSKCPENGGVFGSGASLVRLGAGGQVPCSHGSENAPDANAKRASYLTDSEWRDWPPAGDA